MNILLVGEGPTDPPVTCGLTDRVLRAEIGWLVDQDLDHHRRFRGLDSGRGYVRWDKVPTSHTARFGRTRRGFGGRGLLPDQRATHKLLQLIAAAVQDGEAIDAVVIFRDTDKQPERRDGIHNARAEFLRKGGAGPWSQHIAIGVANPKSEAWILAGFEPRDNAEHEKFVEFRQQLGFAPNLEPHSFTASDHDPDPAKSAKSAKNVLDALCPESDRRCACWEETPLDTLRARGGPCGLVEFLDEVRDHIVPWF